MGEMLTLTAEDGFRLSAYKATPAGKPRGAVVVVQEIFGVNHHIKAVTDGFAADGYVSLAPAIFDRVEPGFETGYAPADIERGRATRMKLQPRPDGHGREGRGAGAVQDRPQGRRGRLLPGRHHGLAGRDADSRRRRRRGLLRRGHRRTPLPSSRSARCMLHFGETDASIPPEHWDKIRAAHPKLPVHIYAGAGHGFSCDERGSFHKASHEQARERTIAFFREHLG